MALLEGFFKSRKEKKIASEIVHNCYAEVAKELGITQYKSPRVELGTFADDATGAEHDPHKNKITLRKDEIELYVKCLKYLEEAKDVPESLWTDKKYREAVNNIKSAMDKTYKSIKEESFHEVIHDLDEVDVSKEPTIRRSAEGIADFARFSLLNETKEELVAHIHKYRDVGAPKSRYHLKAPWAYEYLENLKKQKDTTKTGLRGMFDNIYRRIVSPPEKDTAKLKDAVRNQEIGNLEAIFGYRLGALAALGVHDLPKKEKISKIKELLNDANSHHRLSELENLAEKGIEIYKNEIRKNKSGTNLEMQSSTKEVEENLEKMIKIIYEPVNKREKKNAPVAVVSVVLLIAVSLFPITQLNREIYNPPTGWIIQTVTLYPYTAISIVFLATFFMFLRKI